MSAPANNAPVRNRALHDQLHAFACAASERLGGLLESGAEIPYEVAESPGARSVLYRYRPLSDDFVRDRFPELRALSEFPETLAALGGIEGVSAYLRVMGISYVPASERDRAEAALERFLVRVWDESSSFDLEGDRFERAYRELEAVIYEDTAVNTVLAPLLGVSLEAERWDIGSGISLVRGDLCQAPAQAVWGSGRQDHGPNILAVLTVESRPTAPPPLTEARIAFRKLVTAVRLLKQGGAALSSVAWWRTDDGPWQEVPLGTSGRSRGGAYRLEAAERAELVELFELARSRPALGGALPWALARFELGCEQPVALDGLSDYLLAMRALLDRGDPSPEGLARRLGALCAEPVHRRAVEDSVEQAFRLERLVMRGSVDAAYLESIGVGSPDAVVRGVEENLRALLRDLVCGHLEPDLVGIAEGLLAARPAITMEHDAPAPEPPPEADFVVRKRAARPEPEAPTETRPLFESTDEVDTEEAVAVGGVREVEPESESEERDWLLDDDAGDYSAAV
ncbi:MAG: hypothetical protein ACRDLQ_07200 [Solirubrobacterales bacterium]